MAPVFSSSLPYAIAVSVTSPKLLLTSAVMLKILVVSVPRLRMSKLNVYDSPSDRDEVPAVGIIESHP